MVPGLIFTVEKNERGIWGCLQCETLAQATVLPQVIDKGIPLPGYVSRGKLNSLLRHLI